MKRKLLPLLALLPVACHAAAAGDRGDWKTLWDGKTLAGWTQSGPGEFVIEDGALKATGGMGLLWYSAASFGDFTLALEWQVEEAGDNSGVFVRFPDPEAYDWRAKGWPGPEWVAVHEGYELQICDAAGDAHNTGSVYSFQGPSALPARPAGEWNQYEITVSGQRYEIRVNGVLVNEFTGDRGRAGYLGLQNHDDGSPVRFRDIRARSLQE